jgi:dinuclear metal center YbgI/SA1388 family protein
MIAVANLMEYLEQFAPSELAADWDNVGLLLGDPAAEVHRIMTCLTVTPESAAEAVEAGAELIVTHHPVLFRPIQRLTTASPQARILLELIQAGVAVYSPHTAFDNTVGGINEILAGCLELVDLQPLRRREGRREYKVVVFVPETDLARVSDALFAAGAGHIGQYSECSFRQSGIGTFFGSEATNPALGQKGRREEASEWRLEAICPEACLSAVGPAIRRSHSYEEPAYDIYPLQPRPWSFGEGRLGRLPQPMPLGELAERTRARLGVSQLPMVGEPNRSVERVAIVCGAGGGFVADAVRASADVLLTGELRFHDYLEAQAERVALLLPGHYATERLGVEELATRLQKQWPDLTVWASQRERDPVQWL